MPPRPFAAVALALGSVLALTEPARAIAPPPPAPQDQVWLVNGLTGNASGSPAFWSLSAAVANPALQSGDIIVVQGMTDAVGTPLGYSDVTNPAGGVESFPIVVPPGVSIVGNIGDPVYVYDSALPQAAVLFAMQSSAGPRWPGA